MAESPLALSAKYRAQAQAERRTGDLDAARVSLRRAIALTQQAGNPTARAMNISLLAEIEGEASNLSDAFAHFAEAANAFEQTAHHHDAGVTYHQWAKLYYVNGLLEEAGEHFIHSARCFLADGDQRTLSHVARSFRTCLDHLGPAGVASLTQRWVEAGLPEIDGINLGEATMAVLIEMAKEGQRNGPAQPSGGH